MATQINTSTLTNITEYPNSFKRQGAFPLERYSLFNSYEDALEYATNNPISYYGQIIAVSKNAGTIVELYKISRSNESPFNPELVRIDECNKYITFTETKLSVSDKEIEVRDDSFQLDSINTLGFYLRASDVKYYTPELSSDTIGVDNITIPTLKIKSSPSGSGFYSNPVYCVISEYDIYKYPDNNGLLFIKQSNETQTNTIGSEMTFSFTDLTIEPEKTYVISFTENVVDTSTTTDFKALRLSAVKIETQFYDKLSHSYIHPTLSPTTQSLSFVDGYTGNYTVSFSANYTRKDNVKVAGYDVSSETTWKTIIENSSGGVGTLTTPKLARTQNGTIFELAQYAINLNYYNDSNPNEYSSIILNKNPVTSKGQAALYFHDSESDSNIGIIATKDSVQIIGKPLTVQTPTKDTDAATKKYVDDKIASSLPDNIVTTDDTQILTNKTLTEPSIGTIKNGTNTVTVPQKTGTIALTSDVTNAINNLKIPTLTQLDTVNKTYTIDQIALLLNAIAEKLGAKPFSN